MIPVGFCQCGCGSRTNVATETKNGVKRGEHYRYIWGHNRKGTGVELTGYEQTNAQDGSHLAHVGIVERVLGKKLPLKAHVHHVDGNGYNNAHRNLVVCQDAAYHQLLHQRQRALDACGHADWRRCCYCKDYSPPDEMTITPSNQAYHRHCAAEYQRKRTERLEAQANTTAVGFCECGCGGKTRPMQHTDRARGLERGKPRRFIHGHNRQSA